jgi:hypothetical protein
LFEDPTDDIFDGQMGEDDFELPLVTIRFCLSNQIQSNLPILTNSPANSLQNSSKGCLNIVKQFGTVTDSITKVDPNLNYQTQKESSPPQLKFTDQNHNSNSKENLSAMSDSLSKPIVIKRVETEIVDLDDDPASSDENFDDHVTSDLKITFVPKSASPQKNEAARKLESPLSQKEVQQMLSGESSNYNSNHMSAVEEKPSSEEESRGRRTNVKELCEEMTPRQQSPTFGLPNFGMDTPTIIKEIAVDNNNSASFKKKTPEVKEFSESANVTKNKEAELSKELEELKKQLKSSHDEVQIARLNLDKQLWVQTELEAEVKMLRSRLHFSEEAREFLRKQLSILSSKIQDNTPVVITNDVHNNSKDSFPTYNHMQSINYSSKHESPQSTTKKSTTRSPLQESLHKISVNSKSSRQNTKPFGTAVTSNTRSPNRSAVDSSSKQRSTSPINSVPASLLPISNLDEQSPPSILLAELRKLQSENKRLYSHLREMLPPTPQTAIAVNTSQTTAPIAPDPASKLADIASIAAALQSSSPTPVSVTVINENTLEVNKKRVILCRDREGRVYGIRAKDRVVRVEEWIEKEFWSKGR